MYLAHTIIIIGIASILSPVKVACILSEIVISNHNQQSSISRFNTTQLAFFLCMHQSAFPRQ